MSTEPQPSIAELWGEFQKLANSPRFTNMEGMEDGYTDTVNKRDEKKKKSLRAQLLERCEKDLGLSISCGDVCRITRTPFHYISVCGIKRAKEESAAWGFMAWELEQRAKEK